MPESTFHPDANHPDLVWVIYGGPTWNEYNELLTNFEAYLKQDGENICVIFTPQVDLPKGSPLPHIQRFIRMVENYPRFDLLLPIVPPWMGLAKVFVNIALQFSKTGKGVELVSTEEAALARYQQYHNAKQQGANL